MKKIFLFLMIVSSVFGMSAFSIHKHPNIVFIFSDDQCWDTIGAIGGEVLTPHLDKLVGEGVFFKNAYNSGAWQGAVCIASRTMLMTGKQLWKSHQYSDSKQRNPSDFWSTFFKNNGYKTYFTGKWHISRISPDIIYSSTGTIMPGMPTYSDPKLGGNYKWNERGAGYFRPIDETDQTWDPSDPLYGGFWEGGIHWSEITGHESVDFILQQAHENKPFFMQVAFNAPHDPRQSPIEFIEQYDVNDIKLPKNFLPLQPHAVAMQLAKGMTRDEDLGPFPRTPYSVIKNRQEYFALITHMDEQIGKILDALEKTGKKENTIIIFTSDHGLACGQHGLMGKQNMYEHSMKPPLIISGPNLPKGIQIDTPVYMQDLMPTTLELAGINIPSEIDFKSLLPVIKGQKTYSAIYGAYKDKQRMVRKDNMKLIWYPDSDTWLLFDLDNDSIECTNLADKPEYQAVLHDLKNTLINEQEKWGDPLLSGNFGNMKE